ncbi:tetratricopeptide repeat-containing glycosyltransferase family 2 protein [Bacillus toyonensis]|uniref:tetratricopeptide repeat-containing glycosyltransferase family 2 protein n=1 Tax=Bacillus toyonensis TaxID=155322 RepID=UPI000BFBDCDA|nr:glycosyltransferase family 2 protein [Bacillus toyonensis]PHE24211.1 glycosyl transferase [Bacillus toyonensis]
MITISMCIIVKNEEKTLERCLKSVEGIPDEIIIIDTGSTDLTKKVAKQWTQHVLDFKWINDFSAARNYSFNQAKMDYIFWLDADDILLPKEHQKLLDLKQTLNPNIDAVSMIYHTEFDINNNVLTSIPRIRLIKRDKKFQWYGVVHEDLHINNQNNIYESDIIVTHKKIHNNKKSTRNLKIYEQYYKKNKDKMTLHDIFHYARELQKHKKYKEAIKFYLIFLDSQDIQIEHRLFVMHKLASCYYLIGDFQKEKEITLHSLEYDIPQPEFSCRLGELFLKKDQFYQAIFWFKQAIEFSSTNSSLFIEQQPFKTWLPHKQLALCYYQIDDYKQSYYHNKMVLKYSPNDKETIINIKTIEQLINTK